MKRILLVEDDWDTLMLFRHILEVHGYIVDGYANPLLALSGFVPNSYDLLILDHRMPNLDGLSLHNHIQQKDNSVKALLITANYEQVDMGKVKKLQQETKLKVVKKPVAVMDFLKEVESILN